MCNENKNYVGKDDFLGFLEAWIHRPASGVHSPESILIISQD